MMNKNIYVRGDIFLVDFSLGQDLSKVKPGDSVQTGQRPAIIIQNNKGNATSNTTIVIPLTSASKNFAIHPKISSFNNSFALIEQMRVVDNSRLLKKLGEVTLAELNEIANAIDSVFAFNHDNEVVYVKLNGVGNEYNNLAPVPCLVVQAKEGFRYTNTLLVVPLSTQKKLDKSHVKLPSDELNNRFKKDSFALFEQLVVISKLKIKSKQFKCNFSDDTIENLKKSFRNSISI